VRYRCPKTASNRSREGSYLILRDARRCARQINRWRAPLPAAVCSRNAAIRPDGHRHEDIYR
ncbi:MAG: hypothetical protein ABJA62_00635, partial [Luteimonas sp.]